MKKQLTLIPLIAVMGIVGLTGCTGGGGGGSSSSTSGSVQDDYSFTLALESNRSTIEVGDHEKISILQEGTPKQTPVFQYSSQVESVATVDQKGNITPLAPGKAVFKVVDTANNKQAFLSDITVIAKAEKASGGFNYSAAAGAEAIATRTKILGALEKYAMESHLTGITLFENGGYVKYAERVKLPTTSYITGYGFGILTEGELTAPLEKEQNVNHKMYLHTATSSDPLKINEMNDNGSQVGDLASYITSSFWGTKMNPTKNGYDWYPVLAKYSRPEKQPSEPENELGLYKKWRIYVKTGTDGNVKYSTLSSARSAFNGQGVALADYEFKYQALLTGANGMLRGSEMAADQTYGIKGAQQYYNRTKNMTNQETIDKTWSDMKSSGALGIKTGSDARGSYLDLEILNPIDSFTAMYTFSSSLLSPLPRSFITTIGGGSVIEGMKKYGQFNSGGDDAILDYTLCLGPYTLEAWQKNKATVYKQNASWFERSTLPERYKIAGIKMIVDTNATENPEAIYNLFNSGEVDSCGIPTSKIEQEKNQPRVYVTKGDSTFKLNVNSCDKATWNELFGGKSEPWEIKPWMSNDDFLNGLFYSINRKEFAEKRGVKPSINYFSDAYLSDPERGISYNDTPEHKEATKAFQIEAGGEDMYGYSKTKAIECFKRAVTTLKKTGDIKDGQTIKIHIRWMYESDKTEYGNDIIRYFTEAFNSPLVSNNKVKLEVEQDAVNVWNDVYEKYLMTGRFDLGFGAISGNTYNPLNFLEVLKSDNSSGFTLNWGTNTSKVDDKHALIYDGKRWSFDALWNVSDHGGVVEQGEIIKSVKHAYCELPRKISGGATTNNLCDGVTIKVPVEFISANDVVFNIADSGAVQIYLIGAGNRELNYVKSSDGKYVTITITAAEALEIDTAIREANKLRAEDGNPNPVPSGQAFIWDSYHKYFEFEIYYTITIKSGSPTQNYVSVAKNKGEWDDDNQ